MDSTLPYVSSPPTAPVVPAEPFGQTGVRQYLARVVTWLCIAGFVCACGMWYRSLQFADRLDWREGKSGISIASVAGRIKVATSTYRTDSSRSSTNGWDYRGQHFSNVEDRWKPSIMKTVGIEIGFTPEERRAVSGAWLRVKWYFIVALFAFVPAVQLLIRWRRLRKERA
ncbi:MAG: hypothetical protein H7144_13670 [Burkholderiales bacterium]|nr:hypothetical protein [Phycisphaerae bacterium]